MERNKAKIELIGGVEGDSLYLNDFRICGNKPWGGGHPKKTWEMTIEDILTAIAIRHKEDKVIYKIWHNGNYKITFERDKPKT